MCKRTCHPPDLLCGKHVMLTIASSLVSTIFSPAVPAVQDEFNNHDDSISSLMVSIYVMGAAIGPLILTPITEMSGRLPMTHAANFLFLAADIVCAASVNMPMLIVSRLFMGMASSVPVTVGGGFVSDMMKMDERGTAMTIWTVGPLLGFVTGKYHAMNAPCHYVKLSFYTGPIFGGYMVERVGWRWTVWLEAIVVSLCSAYQVGKPS